jgi:hypothetical protein
VSIGFWVGGRMVFRVTIGFWFWMPMSTGSHAQPNCSPGPIRPITYRFNSLVSNSSSRRC